LLKLATGAAESGDIQNTAQFADLLAAARENAGTLPEAAAEWRRSLEAGYPNLLSAQDVERRERIVLKLLRLIPKEYQSGVRDGEVTIPIEYREAKSFTIQTRQIVNELMPVWRQAKAQAFERNGQELLVALEGLEGAIERKTAQSEIDSLVAKASSVLQNDFGLTLKRAGMGSDVVAETALEVRSLLGQSNFVWMRTSTLTLRLSRARFPGIPPWRYVRRRHSLMASRASPASRRPWTPDLPERS
jgi:hypothetical protein